MYFVASWNTRAFFYLKILIINFTKIVARAILRLARDLIQPKAITFSKRWQETANEEAQAQSNMIDILMAIWDSKDINTEPDITAEDIPVEW